MKQTNYEPGVLPVFRLLTALEMIVLLVILRLQVETLRNPPDPKWYLTWSALIVPLFILLVFLALPRLRQRMGKLYLPTGLGLASIGPILAQYMLITTDLPKGILYDVATGAWQSVLVLFIPLVITSWQYPYRGVAKYIIITSLASFILILLTPSLSSGDRISFLSVLLIRTLFFFVLGYMITRLLAAQREQRLTLAQANAKLAHYAATLEELTISRERNRLARELHDTLAHTLSSQAVQLEAVKALWKTDPNRAYEMVDACLAGARNGLAETRRAIKALRAAPLDDLGLLLALRSLAEDMAERTGLKIDLTLPEQIDSLTPDVEQAVYRVAQEALENAARHARAEQVKISLQQSDGFLTFEVFDDGRGFSPKEVNKEHHFGIHGMRERAERVGGHLEIQSGYDSGTTVRLKIGGYR